MSYTPIAGLKSDRPQKVFAARLNSTRRSYDTWSGEDEMLGATRKRVCDKTFTIESLAVRGPSATTARVKTTISRHRQTTTDGGDAHDGALFRRLEEFFAARRAEVRANKVSAPA
jgi:hypothetical protein